MFTCERCGSSYSPLHAAGVEYCPRCLARDRVESPLAFKAFKLNDTAKPEKTKLKRVPLASPGAAREADRLQA